MWDVAISCGLVTSEDMEEVFVTLRGRKKARRIVTEVLPAMIQNAGPGGVSSLKFRTWLQKIKRHLIYTIHELQGMLYANYYQDVHAEYMAEHKREKEVEVRRKREEAKRQEARRAEESQRAEERRLQRVRAQKNMAYVNRKIEENAKYVDDHGREQIIFVYREVDVTDFTCVNDSLMKIKEAVLAQNYEFLQQYIWTPTFVSHLESQGVIENATHYLQQMGYFTPHHRSSMSKRDLLDQLVQMNMDAFKRVCDEMHRIVATDNVVFLFFQTLREAMDTLPHAAPIY